VGRINGEYGRVGGPAIHYLNQRFDRAELAALYLSADVMVVTPLRDGMNLVGKEYVAARTDGTGALVLSEFAGAAAELDDAFLVNPHDLDGLKATLLAAMDAPAGELAARMAAMRRQVTRHDIRAFTRAYLAALDDSGELLSLLPTGAAPG
jgi:trehalose 6-phosphate synthase